MLRWLLLGFVTISVLRSTQAQINLVPNPSFEEYDTCYNIHGDQEYPRYWYNPTTASPDYHNGFCGNGLFYGVPQNGFGFQYARTGIGFIGLHSTDFFIYPQFGGGSSEYFQCRLLTPLKDGSTYKVTFFVSLADSNRYACDNLGVYISDTAIWRSDANSFDLRPSVVSPPKIPITDKENWVEVSDEYTANGGEEYLTIGMLSPFDSVYSVVVDSYAWDRSCYYYFDDVSVVEVDNTPFRMSNAFTPNCDGVNDVFYPVLADSTAKIIEFRIYNVWGTLVHNCICHWDGSYLATPQPLGIYMYYVLLEATTPGHQAQNVQYSKTGYFTLIR